MSAPEPTFSVIVPVFNRAGMIRRALDSVLRQDLPDYEIVVVDDASSDGSADLVARLDDPRVHLLRHPRNRGVCAARNTAIAHARGTWCVMLDSDFELLPGALAGLAARCAAAAPDVANLASMCTWDRGPDTPHPCPAEELLLDYPAYLRFVAGLQISEWFNCIRRSVFETVRYPEGRAYEGGFHLAVARRFRFALTRDRYVKIYTDATNRITASPPRDDARRMLRDAHDSALDARRILDEHGPALRAYAPALHARYAQAALLHHLLAGERSRALGMLPQLLPAGARSPSLWAFLGLGLLGPRPLAHVKAHWSWLRRSHA